MSSRICPYDGQLLSSTARDRGFQIPEEKKSETYRIRGKHSLGTPAARRPAGFIAATRRLAILLVVLIFSLLIPAITSAPTSALSLGRDIRCHLASFLGSDSAGPELSTSEERIDLCHRAHVHLSDRIATAQVVVGDDTSAWAKLYSGSTVKPL